MTTEIKMWVVYDHPKAFPNTFVARLWIGETPSEEIMVSDDLEQLRDQFDRFGLTRLPRSETDDARVVEVWL